MKKLRKKIYMTAGYNTISMGTGRKEFNPKKPRAGIEEHIKEAGQGVLKQIGGAIHVDESVIGNFMASRFNKQANLAGFMPFIDKELRYKSATRVEGACCSGGLALTTAIRAILAETSDVVLTLGFEVQNTVKAIYGADILAGAGWFKERKNGHAYFFPGQFSNRAGAYFKAFGREKIRQAMAYWYKNAIDNARLCSTAQEFQNTTNDLEQLALTEPNPTAFVDNLNVFDCSKVSDGASAIAVVSEAGLKRLGINPKNAVEVIGFSQVEEDITKPPLDLTKLDTTRYAVEQALKMAGITVNDLGTIECHDCFTIAGLLAVEAIGLANYGEGADYILAGNMSRNGKIPMNTTGGLIGWGHPTGATGVHQAVTIWEQLTGNAGNAQIQIQTDRPYGLTVNMGGDDKTIVVIVYKRG
jgi:acetyl-CoA C-acetyltransferase/acetyl-CoA acyltransferase